MPERGPLLVTTIHDPEGILYSHFATFAEPIKALFPGGIIGLSPQTLRRQKQWASGLHALGFDVLEQVDGGSVGEHFRSVFRRAVEDCSQEQVLHLADIDRLMFALSGEYAGVLAEDLAWAQEQAGPVLFQRSPLAWQTHPENYRQVEGLVIEAGRLLFGRYYDFAWSHLVLSARRLTHILPALHGDDFGFLIHMVLLLRQDLITREVDWLAWEDPFILRRDPQALWLERSQDASETRKRLRGILPFFPYLNHELAGDAPGWERK